MRQLTQTGHRPIPDPVPVTDPDVGEPPAGLSPLGLELWNDYVADRRALGVLTRLDRFALILACEAVSRAERSRGNRNLSAIDMARRLLTELLATPAARLKLASLMKREKPAQQRTTGIGRSLDLILGGKQND
jgi:hypothetical protein